MLKGLSEKEIWNNLLESLTHLLSAGRLSFPLGLILLQLKKYPPLEVTLLNSPGEKGVTIIYTSVNFSGKNSYLLH